MAAEDIEFRLPWDPGPRFRQFQLDEPAMESALTMADLYRPQEQLPNQREKTLGEYIQEAKASLPQGFGGIFPGPRNRAEAQAITGLVPQLMQRDVQRQQLEFQRQKENADQWDKLKTDIGWITTNVQPDNQVPMLKAYAKGRGLPLETALVKYLLDVQRENPENIEDAFNKLSKMPLQVFARNAKTVEGFVDIMKKLEPTKPTPHYFQSPEGTQMVIPQPGAAATPVPGAPPGQKVSALANVPDNVIAGIATGVIKPITFPEGTVLDQAGAKKIWDEKVRLMGEVGSARALAWQNVRTVNMLDTAQGNKPVTITVAQMLQQPDRYITAGPGVQALNKTALIEDIRGGIDRVRTSLERLPSFSGAQRAQLALILRDRDPRSAMQAFFTSQVGQTLNDEQQQYVADLTVLAENAMAMRTILGAGQGSDMLRSAILATIPSAGTPNKAMARKQLDAFEGVLDRLSRGVPQVPLRPETAPQTAPESALAAPTMTPQQQQAFEAAPEGARIRLNGQFWIKKKGQLTRPK